MRYFPKTTETDAKILNTLGLKNSKDIFSSIPSSARFNESLDLPAPLDELSLKRALTPFLLPPKKSFLGAGLTSHFVPEWVSQQLLRAEWYTSYTPYQPEASQGTLQAIFEFQSVVASLFGLDVANGSMYDGATALAEALLMAVRVKKKPAVLVSSLIHPEYRETLKTYLTNARIAIHEFGFDETGKSTLDKAISETIEFSAIACQIPNFFSCYEDLQSLKTSANENDALLVATTTEPLALALIKSPGNLGVDIMTGEGIGFCGAPNLGGPGVGLFAGRAELLRQMPGRLVGKTIDQSGHDGFVLTLSTREQHIRRERATSNICTNHNLMALAFLMTLSAYGKSGFLDLAKRNIKKTLYFRKKLKEHHIPIKFDGPHFNETVVDLGTKERIKKVSNTAQRDAMALGLDLGRFYRGLDNCLLIATTELHTDSDIDHAVKILAGDHDRS